MNTFTLVTLLSGFAVIASFFCGVRAMILDGQGGYLDDETSMAWHMAFYVAVFATILAAPLAH